MSKCRIFRESASKGMKLKLVDKTCQNEIYWIGWKDTEDWRIVLPAWMGIHHRGCLHPEKIYLICSGLLASPWRNISASCLKFIFGVYSKEDLARGKRAFGKKALRAAGHLDFRCVYRSDSAAGMASGQGIWLLRCHTLAPGKHP